MRENKRVFPGDASRGEIEILREGVVWENEVARLFNDHVRFPATEAGRHVEAEQFRLAPAASKDDGVVVVPVTGDDRILLVRQFRHPVRISTRSRSRRWRASSRTSRATASRTARTPRRPRTRTRCSATWDTAVARGGKTMCALSYQPLLHGMTAG